MKFTALQENLRKALWARIDAGELTGLRLADQIGVEQGHISNFLNRKRGLSLDAMDRVLAAQKLSVLDLLHPAEVNKRATILPPSEGEFDNVLVVDPKVAASSAAIMQKDVRDVLKFKKAFLRRLRSDAKGARAKWVRFVLIKVDAHDGMGMYPRLLPGATVLIDRHYNSLKPYRRGTDRNMYAVRTAKGGCTVRYVEMSEHTLILRPHNQDYPIGAIRLDENTSPEDAIVGRVCHVEIET